MEVIRYAWDSGRSIWAQRDPRVQSWFLVSNPLDTFILTAMYLLISIRLGRRFMRDRKPYNIKGLIIAYNIVVVIINAWICYLFLSAGWATTYNFMCEPVSRATDEQNIRMATATYWYFLTKYLDWCDTLFFIMRKKFSHLTVLHIYHHSTMPFNILLGLHYAAVGHHTLGGPVNSFVHTVMYSYYILAAISQDLQKHIWIKKLVTSLQLCQFFLVSFHDILPLVNDCDTPKPIAVYLLSQGGIFIALFANFYVKSYRKKKVH